MSAKKFAKRDLVRVRTCSVFQMLLGNSIAACILSAHRDSLYDAAAVSRISAPLGMEYIRRHRHGNTSLDWVLHLEHGAACYLSGVAFTLIGDADDDS